MNRTELTEQDRVVIYQLEKVDQGGDVMDLFESQQWSVAEALGLEIEDDEESPGCGCVKLGNDRWATLTMRAVVFDSQGDVEARVYLATRYSRWADVPEDLEIEDRVILGVYGSEESAQQAIAEAAAEEWEEAISDLDLTDEDEEEEEAFAFMKEHRWEVEPQTVLS